MSLQFNTTPLQQNWGTGGLNTQTQNTQTTGPRGLLFGDSIQSIGDGLNVFSFLYLQDIGLPILPPPQTTQTSDTFFYNRSFNTDNFKNEDSKPNYQSTYLKTFDGILEQAVEKNGLSKEQANQITFAAMMGIPVPNNPQLNKVLSDIQDKVVTQMNETFRTDSDLAKNNWSQVKDQAKSQFKNSLGRAFEGAFQESLDNFAKENGLTESQVAQLKYAHYNPDDPMSPEIKKMIGEINNEAIAKMGSQWGLPEGFIPEVNNSEFNAVVSYNYEEAFKEGLQDADLSQLANKLGISQESLKGIMSYIHGQTEEAGKMDPQKLGLANASQLQQVVQAIKKLESGAAGKIAESSGLPEGVVPGDGGDSFEHMLSGRVLQQFEYNLKNQSPPLNEQQIAEVLLAVKNPLDPNISTETKTLISNIFEQAVSEVRTEYSVPSAWTPDVSMLKSLSNRGPEIRMANAGLQFAADSLNMALKYLDPKNPNDSALINVIKAVSIALAELKNAIAEMESRNARVQALVTDARSQATLYKIKIQNEKLEEALKKARKMKPLMAFMKIFGPIFKAIMAIIFALFVPVGPMLAASMFQDIATGGKENFLTDMFTKIMKDLPRPANIAVSAAVMWGLAACSGIPNPMLFMQIFFENSKILPEIAMACGADEMEAQMVNMVAKIVTEILIMIVLTILTGGAAGAALMGQIQAAVTQVAIKVLQTVLNAVQKVVDVLKQMGGVAEKVAQVLQKFANTLLKKIQNLTKALEKLAESTKITEQIKNTETALRGVKEGTEEFKNLSKELEVLTKTLEDVNKQIADLGGNVFDNVRKGMTIGTDLASAATAGVQSAISIMQAQLDKFNSEMDAQIEELKNMIKILTETLQKLMQGMTSMVTWTSEIGKQQSHMWQNLSQTTTAIANANQS